MKACIPIMENLSLNIYQEVLEKERDNDDCWCEVQCLLCGKSCHVKNIHLEPMSAFLMKIVFSIWLKHVLAIAPKEDSMWDQAHPLWYICTERHGCYYESLKSAYISDLDKFARKNGKGRNKFRFICSRFSNWRRKISHFSIARLDERFFISPINGNYIASGFINERSG